MAEWLVLLAAEAPAAPPPSTGNPLLDLVIRNGTPIVFALLAVWAFLTNRIFPGSERERLLAKLEKTEAQRDAYRDGIDEKVIPLMHRALTIIEQQERRLEGYREDRGGHSK